MADFDRQTILRMLKLKIIRYFCHLWGVMTSDLVGLEVCRDRSDLKSGLYAGSSWPDIPACVAFHEDKRACSLLSATESEVTKTQKVIQIKENKTTARSQQKLRWTFFFVFSSVKNRP